MTAPSFDAPLRLHRPLACILALGLTACGSDSPTPPEVPPPDPPPGSTLDEEGTWIDLAPIPVPVHGAAAAAYRGAIYVTGGGTGSVNAPPTALVQRYDPDLDEWTRLNDLPITLSLHAITVFRDTLLILGGQRSESGLAATGKILAYDPDSDAWTEWGNLPLPLWDVTAVTVRDRILVMGGVAFIGPPGDSLTVIEDAGTWHYAPPPRNQFGLDILPAVLDDRAFVLTTGEGFRMDLFEFDLVSETWSPVPVQPVTDLRVEGTTAGGRFHVLGDGQPAPKHRAFVTGGGDAWLTLTPPERVLVDRLVVGLGNRVYAIAGFQASTGLVAPDVAVYVPPS